MDEERVLVIGAGVGGLAAAIELAARGLPVTLLERAQVPGGKLRCDSSLGAEIDAGPTVLTWRGIFDELFASAGTRLEDHLTLAPLGVLARHAWSESERLDLHADPALTRAAIGAFAGSAEARRYERFSAQAARIFATLERSFMLASRPGPLGLALRLGPGALPDLLALKPFTSLWRALGSTFRDARLQQLFGRYATYCGCSPYAAPATLMLIAHLEARGVWRIAGGMRALARALTTLATKLGVEIACGREVESLCIRGGAVTGVRLRGGEDLKAQAVIHNGDADALRSGLLGADVRGTLPALRAPRSLSAVTWTMQARTTGFPLEHHNVFFSADYRREFTELFGAGQVPSAPTVYVCAQDRPGAVAGPERLLCLINAPANGDTRAYTDEDLERCEHTMRRMLGHCGLEVQAEPGSMRVRTPADFAQDFPGTGGALYGRATHGWQASFQRPGTRTRIRGLYLAGGSVHPGPGMPMATQSGRLAAASLIADRASMRRSSRVATPGGTSMP